MKRVVQPELLDMLPHDHPEAIRNRRDLLRLNTLMGTHRWICSVLRRKVEPGDRILEIGAGRGEMAQRIRKAVAARGAIAYDGLDLCPIPEAWPAKARWRQGDALEFDGYDGYQVVVANLLLHQFDDAELRKLGARIADSARLIVACEPARRRRHLAQLRLLGLLGLGRVTRHDGAVSIRAGFLAEELPRLLGLERTLWRWHCCTGFRGQYFMVAERREGAAGEQEAAPQELRKIL